MVVSPFTFASTAYHEGTKNDFVQEIFVFFVELRVFVISWLHFYRINWSLMSVNDVSPYTSRASWRTSMRRSRSNRRAISSR